MKRKKVRMLIVFLLLIIVGGWLWWGLGSNSPDSSSGILTSGFIEAKDIAIALFFANWEGNPGKSRSKDDYLTTFFQNFMKGYDAENSLPEFWFSKLPIFLKHHQILLFTVFTDEWKTPNKWQLTTLQRWKRQILNDIPVVKLQF